ncbi:hypothetical protein GGX14DRAFT_569994 [Mycena pura]|uniref:Ricin B lectin domain-containing protein n=1 Tax=Mycena pura TaxID=153505 RepID=A0AAD6Y7G7_9AGAR|nr:hypothetical protein GGX14DRAFT_569994 [Mycena pura]
MVNLTAIALTGTLFSITDFQGHVLDESFGFAADLNPVVGQWAFVATSTPSQFNIKNGNTQTYLSYAGAPAGSTEYAQAVIDGSNPMAFNLLLVNPSPETFNIVDVETGFALTAWSAPVSRGTTVTPVNFSPPDLAMVALQVLTFLF